MKNDNNKEIILQTEKSTQQFLDLLQEQLFKNVINENAIKGKLSSSKFGQKMKFKIIVFSIEETKYMLIKFKKEQGLFAEEIQKVQQLDETKKPIELSKSTSPSNFNKTKLEDQVFFPQKMQKILKSLGNQRINEVTFKEEDDQLNEGNSSQILEIAEERLSGEMTPNSVDISKLSFATFHSPSKLPQIQEEFQLENFMTMIIHDFRTPLFCLTLMLEKLKEENIDNKTKSDSIEIALTNISLLENYVNDILDLKQLTAGKLQISPEPFNLQQFVQDIIKVIVPLASLKQTTINLDFQYDPAFIIISDQRRLKQILINLLSNAVKFTNQGKIEMKIFQVFGNFIQFSVKDSGCGIRPEIIPLLSQPYKTFNQNGMNKQGVGLGLYFSKKLIGKLGPEEKMHIESEYGHGTIFSFKIYRNLQTIYNLKDTFRSQIFQTENSEDYYSSSISKFSKSQRLKSPQFISSSSSNRVNTKQNTCHFPQLHKLAQDDDKLSSRSAKNLMEHFENNEIQSKSQSQQMIKLTKESHKLILGDVQKNINILIVDDSPFNLMILENYLQSITTYKFCISKAYNGQEAIDQFTKNNKISNKNNFQIIIMDCEMPILNGYTATQTIKHLINTQYFIETLIIAYSGHQDQSQIELCQESQFDGVLKKPSGLKEFSEFIKEILASILQ